MPIVSGPFSDPAAMEMASSTVSTITTTTVEAQKMTMMQRRSLVTLVAIRQRPADGT